jgi:hypothetical protein
MKEKVIFALESMLDIAYYNGLIKDCERLFTNIYAGMCGEEESVPLPEWLKEYDCNHFLRVLWSILVIEYGDYGTSPRFGWIYTDTGVKEVLEEFYEYVEDNGFLEEDV